MLRSVLGFPKADSLLKINRLQKNPKMRTHGGKIKQSRHDKVSLSHCSLTLLAWLTGTIADVLGSPVAEMKFFGSVVPSFAGIKT